MKKSIRVRDLMSTPVISLSPEMPIIRAMRILLDNDISSAPVLRDSVLIVGILSQHDCLRAALNAHYHQVWGGQVSDYMSPTVHTIEASMELVAAADYFTKHKYRRYPVIDSGRLIGQISRRDLLEALCDEWN